MRSVLDRFTLADIASMARGRVPWPDSVDPLTAGAS
jgi:hypothetical protein